MIITDLNASSAVNKLLETKWMSLVWNYPVWDNATEPTAESAIKTPRAESFDTEKTDTD